MKELLVGLVVVGPVLVWGWFMPAVLVVLALVGFGLAAAWVIGVVILTYWPWGK